MPALLKRVNDKMPANVFEGGPCAYRFSDYLQLGSIYTLPDDLRLQRGPTLVILPEGREVQVPATQKRNVAAQSEHHDMRGAQAKMMQLLAMINGKKRAPDPPPGWKSAPAGRPEIGRHPFRMPRAMDGLGAHTIHF